MQWAEAAIPRAEAATSFQCRVERPKDWNYPLRRTVEVKCDGSVGDGGGITDGER